MTESNCHLEVFIDTNLAYHGKYASFKCDGSRCHHAAIATKVNQTLKHKSASLCERERKHCLAKF